ncbi:hypothetical protein [Desulfitobacterium hafniense]|uniref:hypothetical protein n=1 Tax=Desulfitobacterium hafniense TaxID=49338 RepID=UPI00037D78E3|nr:hypothetical protein [Desulfitobacterium hafniense]
MWKKVKKANTIFAGLALIGGLVIGTLFYSSIPALGSNFGELNKDGNYVLKINQSGETYGSMAGASSYEQIPDLILAEGIDGTVGYVKNLDLNQGLPKNPEEAVAYMKNLKDNGFRKIPLYAVDGKTVIGEYQVGTPQIDEEALDIIQKDIDNKLGGSDQ